MLDDLEHERLRADIRDARVEHLGQVISSPRLSGFAVTLTSRSSRSIESSVVIRDLEHVDELVELLMTWSIETSEASTRIVMQERSERSVGPTASTRC